MQLPYFYQPSIMSANATLMLSEETSKHCIQVLRMKAGDKLQLINGKGSLYTAVIVAADKKRCSATIEETGYQKQEERKVCVAISLLKNASRWEWFLEKAVEMGVHEIIPLLCIRTEKQHYKTERAQGIVISAMLQSRQLWLPVLHQPTTLAQAISSSDSFTQKLIAHCIDNDSKTALSNLPVQDNVQILIGPEGDFTEPEIALALHHQYLPVSLGHTRLRTETAGLVASALLIHSPKNSSAL